MIEHVKLLVVLLASTCLLGCSDRAATQSESVDNGCPNYVVRASRSVRTTSLELPLGRFASTFVVGSAIPQAVIQIDGGAQNSVAEEILELDPTAMTSRQVADLRGLNLVPISAMWDPEQQMYLLLGSAGTKLVLATGIGSTWSKLTEFDVGSIVYGRASIAYRDAHGTTYVLVLTADSTKLLRLRPLSTSFEIVDNDIPEIALVSPKSIHVESSTITIGGDAIFGETTKAVVVVVDLNTNKVKRYDMDKKSGMTRVVSDRQVLIRSGDGVELASPQLDSECPVLKSFSSELSVATVGGLGMIGNDNDFMEIRGADVNQLVFEGSRSVEDLVPVAALVANNFVYASFRGNAPRIVQAPLLQ